jgi:molybdenum cofactor cytidylyltransferase
MSTAAVILAAGASSRMGGPKQVLEYGGVSLLRRAAITALDAGCEPVVVVTGAHAELSRRELHDLAVQEVTNAEWLTGMASSLRAGVLHVATHPAVETLLVMLCDQPHVSADLLRTLVAAHASTGKPIVACGYGGTVGVPALFARLVWPECTSLAGPAGAKHIIETDGCRAHVTPFPDGAIDIDTPADLVRLQTLRGSADAGVQPGNTSDR